MKIDDYNDNMAKTQNEGKTDVPLWARAPYSDVLEMFGQLSDVLTISTQGIRALLGMPGLVEALEKLNADPNEGLMDESKKKIEYAERLSQLAKHEVEADFPLLHSQAIVTIWGYLEGAIYNFVASWIQHQPSAKRVPELNKIKIRLVEYEELDEMERCHYLIDLIQVDIGGSYKKGVNRFEGLLNVFGLAGQVAEETKKNLYELYEVRNVIVHRHSKADRKLLEACPWFDIELGEKIIVTREMYGKYMHAVMDYMTEVLDRVFHFYGEDFRGFMTSL